MFHQHIHLLAYSLTSIKQGPSSNPAETWSHITIGLASNEIQSLERTHLLLQPAAVPPPKKPPHSNTMTKGGGGAWS